jgi:hypothetical protein
VTATIGWNSVTKTLDDARRYSGAFAIIADLLAHQQAATSAGAVNTTNKLNVFWSTQNTGGLAEGSDWNLDTGSVVGVGGYFLPCGAAVLTTGIRSGCDPDRIPAIYLSGKQTAEMMEFSFFITAHEATHFTQSVSMRSFSVAGPHDYSQYQDFTNTHHEGFANGVAGIIARSPRLERYNPRGGVIYSSVTDISRQLSSSPIGWFQEDTFAVFLWRLFDPVGSIKMSPRQIFGPYYSEAWRQGSFVPNIWAYGKILKDQNPVLATVIDQLGASLNITLAGNDVIGSTERVKGNRTDKQTFPVIATVPLSGSIEVCTVGKPYELNLLGNRRYLKVLGDGTPKKYTITGPESSVPYADFSRIGTFFSKGEKSTSRTLTVPATGTWGYVGECKVSLSKSSEIDAQCSDKDYVPPEEQCWTIKVE